MITVGFVVTTRFDLLLRAIKSLPASIEPIDRVLVLDQRDGCSEEVYAEIKAILNDAGIALEWGTPERQISLAAAWNRLIMWAQRDWIILANDDIEIEPDTIGSLIRAAEAHPDELVFVSPQDPVNEFSLFLIRHRALNVVGRFDEAFWPVFHEDVDYRHRMKVLGFHVIHAQGCAYRHVHSATLKAKTPEEQAQHWQQFAAMRARYVSKWGGLPGQERFTVPFDGKVAVTA